MASQAWSGLAALAVMLAPWTTRAQPVDQEVQIDGGRAPLHGALLRPDRPRSGPAVLIIPGSGPTDRDSNSTDAGLRPATLKLLAQALAENGYASLRIDKRGVGASKPAAARESDARLTVLVEDAAAWTRFLRQQPQVRCVVLLGHSEGALIAALAAAKVEVCGVVSVSGAGRPFDQLILAQATASGAGPAMLQRFADIEAAIKRGDPVNDVPPPLQPLFRPALQPSLHELFAADPAAALAAVKAPVLILQGTTDVQISVEDARRLAAAQPRAKLVLLEGVNHILKTAPPERAANVATYADPNLPLAPSVMPPILSFLASLAR